MFGRDGPDRFTLTCKTVLETPITDATAGTVITAAIDRKVGEGYWTGRVTNHTKYRGRMAKFPDEHKGEELRGGAVLPLKSVAGNAG